MSPCLVNTIGDVVIGQVLEGGVKLRLGEVDDGIRVVTLDAVKDKLHKIILADLESVRSVKRDGVVMLSSWVWVNRLPSG